MAISLIIILSLSFSSAIIITEVELNPSGSDSGAEWIELYSESSSLEGYSLENEDGGIYPLNGSINGYLVIQFSKQWLDNSKAFVRLKKDNITLFETSELSDLKNNEKSFSLCRDKWILSSPSKGEENECNIKNSTISDAEPLSTIQTRQNSSSNIRTPPQDNTYQANTTSSSLPLANLSSQDKNNESKPDSEIIYLNKPSSKETDTFISKEGKTKIWISYSFTLICIIIIIFLLKGR